MKAFGLARIGKDAEIRYTPDNTAVINLSLAFSYGRKGEDGKRPTTWVDATLWGKQAEALAQYLVKGQQVAVTLEEVRMDTYKTRDGTLGSKIAARISSIDFAGGQQQGQASAPAPAPKAAPRAATKAASDTGFDSMDSDIPFISASMHHDMLTGTQKRMAKYLR